MTDTFLKTLQSVVSGARQLEDFAGTLVGVAVEDTLLCVARDYGHPYATLVKKYKDDVVTRHLPGTASAAATAACCRGTTKGGRACSKRAVLLGYCQTHAAQMAEEESKRRKVEAYRASVAKGTVNREVVAAELFLGRKHRHGDRYRVAPVAACDLVTLL
jgi:hypothetical protein